jgi:hypothetical protein
MYTVDPAALSMPELTQAYRNPSADDESIVPGLYIGNYGDAISINLPSLTNVTGNMALSGAVSGYAGSNNHDILY